MLCESKLTFYSFVFSYFCFCLRSDASRVQFSGSKDHVLYFIDTNYTTSYNIWAWETRWPSG